MAEYPTDVRPEVCRPERVCALVNKNSGERAAAVFVMEQFQKQLGTENVFDLFPEKGKPPAIEEAKAFIAERQPDMVIVAGGDGTVSLGMDITDALREDGRIREDGAAVAVLPMGTGNDLSRSLGFGAGYVKPSSKAEEKFVDVLNKIYTAEAKKVDRFEVTVSRVTDEAPPSTNGATESEKDKHHPYSESDAPANRSTPQDPKDALFRKSFMNYFSVGFDAEVATKFGNFRDKNPEMCKSRTMNKMWYGCFGCNALCTSSSLPSHRVSLEIDNTRIKVPSSSKAIIVGNMITYAGGNVLWSDTRDRFKPQRVDDGMVEVTEMEGVSHMAGVITKTRAATKLGQGSRVILRVPANFTMQYDGEPIAPMGSSKEDVQVNIRFLKQSLGMVMPHKKGVATSMEGETTVAEDPPALYGEECVAPR